MLDLEPLNSGDDLVEVIRDKFNRVIAALRELENLTGDGSYITVDHDDNSGFRIVFHPENIAMPSGSADADPAAAAATYDGMFAVAKTGAVNAGVITGPGWIANVNAATLTFPTAAGTYYIILSVGTSGTGTPGRSIEISSTFSGLNDALPGTNGDVQKYLLATLTVADGAATVVQQQHGPVYMNIYRLAPEEDA